jgi:4-oxalocrotonate tautomerase
MIEHCGCKPETIHVIFSDVDTGDWAVAGKLLDHPAA